MLKNISSQVFPAIYGMHTRLYGNPVQQLLVAQQTTNVTLEEVVYGKTRGKVICTVDTPDIPILVIPSKTDIPETFKHVLLEKITLGKDISPSVLHEWIRHPRMASTPVPLVDLDRYCTDALASWKNAFSYVLEDSELAIKGLRAPQIGAIHAIQAHWTTSKQAATIVMPTGTGKTETMLSILVAKCCSKVLVVVPSDALRTQVAAKFLTLGLLKEFKVIDEKAHYPVVGMLKQRPKTIEEVDAIFARCNVVVTTASIVGQCTTDVQGRMAYWCQYLFIDEAHHIGAPSWFAFREKFTSGYILQFTATPFRNDGKLIPGKIIFNFPLRLALEQGYFRRINFQPIVEYDRHKADEAIADKAVAQLRHDLEQFDHILMARVESIDRAEEVYKLYARHPDLNPVCIHTGISSARERAEIRRKILSKEARIIICVDMLGEGFDLPELKIAAFHDVKKSLPITLQLAGRFTRTKPHLGNPTFIANSGTVEFQNELRKLYIQDADWNTLLIGASEEVITNQMAFQVFLEGFRNFSDEIPLHTLRPAMSTVMYKTTCEDWMPERFKQGLQGREEIEYIHHTINYEQKTMVIVTARKIVIGWAQIQDIFNWAWELYVIHWDDTQNLLFINCSGNDGYYQKLAVAIAGDVVLISGPPVFRCFAYVNRLRLQNVGLLERLGKLIRYIMRVGGDVEAGLTEAQKRHAEKSNIFGNGYEGGHKTTIGCSYKGRIWSQRVANIETLVRWCRHIGQKVLDESIDPDEVLRGTLISIPIAQRPHKMPITIDWPEDMYKETEIAYEFMFGDELILPMYLVELRLLNPSLEGDLAFEIASEEIAASFILQLFETDDVKDCHFTATSGRSVSVRKGSRHIPLTEFFYQYSPTIWFADGSSLTGNSFTELKKGGRPYAADKINAWDWSGVDIKKESQKMEKRPDSIQYHVIQQLLLRDYTIIIDDDDAGELADVVAIKVEDRQILVDLFHCKYSSSDQPGGRVGDLYEVCGQAQKSIRWMENIPELFRHLLRRDRQRAARGVGRIEKGTFEELQQLVEMSIFRPVSVHVHIVQPGLSKPRVSLEQLELLSVTENYLMETYKLPFTVIANNT
jgi:superfamily II DNA or RNA helicase